MAEAFLISPFSAESAGGEEPTIFDDVQRAIADACRQANVELVRGDDIFEAGVIVDQIRSSLEAADCVIAVCTGRNANVFYELGLAEILGHRPILVASDSTDLPFDVAHWRAQFYGTAQQLESLVDRVRRAIQATLAARAPEPRLSIAASPPVATLAATEAPDASRLRPTSTVDASNHAQQFRNSARELIRAAARSQRDAVTQNENIQPSQQTLDDLSELRYSIVDPLLDLLVSEMEDHPEWLRMPLEESATWFDEPPTGNRSGFVFWTKQHSTWVYLLFRSTLAAALASSTWPAVRMLFDVTVPLERESAPLLMNTGFMFPGGYGGDARVAFNDFLTYLQRRDLHELTAIAGMDALTLACGSDLSIGLARCLWEARLGHEPGDFYPHAFAAFADYHCERIRWTASRLHTIEDAATALGAADLPEFRDAAEAWFPALARRHSGNHFNLTCRTWPSATGIESD